MGWSLASLGIGMLSPHKPAARPCQTKFDAGWRLKPINVAVTELVGNVSYCPCRGADYDNLVGYAASGWA